MTNVGRHSLQVFSLCVDLLFFLKLGCLTLLRFKCNTDLISLFVSLDLSILEEDFMKHTVTKTEVYEFLSVLINYYFVIYLRCAGPLLSTSYAQTQSNSTYHINFIFLARSDVKCREGLSTMIFFLLSAWHLVKNNGVMQEQLHLQKHNFLFFLNLIQEA